MIVGIDPGKQGALCWMAPDVPGAPEVILPMPLVEGEGRDEYDVPRLVHILDVPRHPDHVFIEKLQPMPFAKGGTIANYQRGFALALLVGICTTLRLPYTLVAPKTWQKVMLAGTPGDDTKQRSILAAKRLFPGVSLKRTPRCKKDDDGFADSLLICEYGRRSLR